MFVIGTAGHVDHGKSTLVMALTGIDPDRLQEEKKRGLTIDLGFAWLELPSGREVSIVDVPGHERFIKNMLAGVGGIDLALLVIAADESVMPQTREHLSILDILKIQRGIVVITKKDLVDAEFLELVKAEVEEVLTETILEGSAIVSVSGRTGDGLAELLKEIDSALGEIKQKRDIQRPRLPIDRAFTISGFGSVITGTLIEGSLSVGQEVELSLMGKRSRIRGLQTHRKKLETVFPGTRVAVNLSGIDYQEIERGDTLTVPGWLKPTKAIDVRLNVLRTITGTIKHNAKVTFHSGASDVTAQIRLLDKNSVQPGENAIAQIKLDAPIVVAKGDFFVVRSSVMTLGGGNILEPYAKRHRRLHATTLHRLEIIEQGTEQDILHETLKDLGPCDLSTLANHVNLSGEELIENISDLLTKSLVIVLGNDNLTMSTVVCAQSYWTNFSDNLKQNLTEYHHRYALRKGAPKEELRSRLGLSSQIFQYSLQRLIKQQMIVEDGPIIRLPEHSANPTDVQQTQMENYVQMLLKEPFSPATDQVISEDLTSLLEETDRIVRISGDIVYEAETYTKMIERIITHTRENGSISVAEVRDMFNTSRKYALPLLEHLDQRRITRRVGDTRILR